MASSRVPIVVTGLASLALGLGLGFVAFSRSEGGPVDPGPIERGSAEGAPRGDAPGPAAAAAPRELAKPGAIAPATAGPEDLASAKRVAAAVPAPKAAAAGTGVLTAEVADPEGRPVAGVTVRLTRQRRNDGRRERTLGAGPPPVPSLDDVVRRAVEDYQRNRPERGDLVTDADGRARFEGVADGSYYAQAWKAGFYLDATGNAWNLRPGATVRFVARSGTPVELRVRMPGGGLADRAIVNANMRRANGGNRGFEDPWSKDEPKFWLTPGKWELKARSTTEGEENGDDAELASPQVTIEVAEGSSPPPVELPLAPRLGIRVRLQVPADEREGEYIVRCMELPEGRAPDLKALANINNPQPQWSSGAGEVRLLDLRPAAYVVGVSRGWNEPIVAHAIASVREGIVEAVLDVPPHDASSSWIVKAIDPKGRPVAGRLDFSLRIESQRSSRTNWLQGVPKRPGEYWITPDVESSALLGKKWAASTKATLEVRSDEYGNQEVALSPIERQYTVQFLEPAMVEAIITNYRGSGFEGRVQVGVRRAAEENRSGHSLREPDADGKANLGPLAPGDYEVAIMLSSRGDHSYESVATQRAALRPGPNSVALAIPALHALTVRAAEGGAGISFYVQRSDPGGAGFSRHQESDDAGAATFEGLPAGEYEVRLMGGPSSGSMRVRVPAQRDVLFKADPVNALVVSVTDAEGTLAKAGFQDGDRVVAIDGKEFASQAELQAIAAAMVAKKEVGIVVERGGKRLELTITPAMMMGRSNMGGSMKPGTR